MSKFSGNELLLSIIDPRNNRGGIPKFCAMVGVGGVGAVFQLMYMYPHEENVQLVVNRFLQGALIFPAFRMGMQMGYYLATSTRANDMVVSGLSGAITALLFLNQEPADFVNTTDYLITISGFVAAAMLVDQFL